MLERARVTSTNDFLGLVKEFKRYSFGTEQTFNDFKQARDKLRFAYLKVSSVWRKERTHTREPIKRLLQLSKGK